LLIDWGCNEYKDAARTMFQKVDENGDGTITFDEFEH